MGTHPVARELIRWQVSTQCNTVGPHGSAVCRPGFSRCCGLWIGCQAPRPRDARLPSIFDVSWCSLAINKMS
jgi:hypothetical protein